MWNFQNKYIESILSIFTISFLLICIVPISIAIYINYIIISNEDLKLILEYIAAFCGIIYIILAAKENILCWMYGSISVIIYSYIFFINNLIAESALQIFYLVMSIYGFINWNRKNDIKIISLSYLKHFLIIFAGFFLTIIISFILIKFSESSEQIIVDSFTTSFALITTFLATRKILENWIYWIIIDIVSIYLCISKELYITSILFVIYTILAIYGYWKWKKQLKKL